MPANVFLRQATGNACRQRCAQAVERVPNESRPNRWLVPGRIRSRRYLV